MCYVLKVPLPKLGPLRSFVGKYRGKHAVLDCNEQYRIAVYIFCFSLAFFGLCQKAQSFFSQIPYPETGATMCITGVTVFSSFVT